MENTASLSLWVYGTIIIVATTAFVIIIKKISKIDTNKPNADNEIKKIDKITEISKYVIVSIMISTVTVVIGDQFKEREYDKNEMAAFDKYLPYIISDSKDKKTTMDKKLSLCKFFCCVAPEGSLRDGWNLYSEHLKDEAKELEKDNENIKDVTNPIDEVANPTEQQVVNLNIALAEQQKRLKNNNLTENTNYLVIIGADKTKTEAEYEINKLEYQYKNNATIYKKGKWFRTVITVNSGFDAANNTAAEIKKSLSGKYNPYVVSLKTWCENSTYSETEKCMVCN